MRTLIIYMREEIYGKLGKQMSLARENLVEKYRHNAQKWHVNIVGCADSYQILQNWGKWSKMIRNLGSKQLKIRGIPSPTMNKPIKSKFYWVFLAVLSDFWWFWWKCTLIENRCTYCTKDRHERDCAQRRKYSKKYTWIYAMCICACCTIMHHKNCAK